MPELEDVELQELTENVSDRTLEDDQSDHIAAELSAQRRASCTRYVT